jgi:hypothetical protein
MWCGGCYSSDPTVSFHVKRLENEGAESEKEPSDRARLAKAWGDKRRAPDAFMKARDGDHTMVPFECDLCIFHKLRKHSPREGNPVDGLMLSCIRRMNLDAFWSSASATVHGNRDKIKMSLRMSSLVGLSGPYNHDGPLPNYDHCGYEIAIEILLYSRRQGKYSEKNLQFDTIRKLRTAYSNHVRASSQANQEATSLGDSKGNYQRFSIDPCGSFWFYRFMKGMKSRMGQDWRPNKGMSVDLLLRVLEETDTRIDGAVSPRELNRWIVFHTYAVVSYVLSLRGKEGLLLDLEGLHRFWESGDASYVVVTLQGTVKGESNDRDHLLPCTKVTTSGVDVKASLARLMVYKTSINSIDGPAISDDKGRSYSTKDMTDSFQEILEDLFDTERHFFPPDITSKEILRERYQAFRSFRKTSDTRAAEMEVSSSDVDIVNRWESVEKAQGKRAAMPMRLHYLQFDLCLKPFLRYTASM